MGRMNPQKNMKILYGDNVLDRCPGQGVDITNLKPEMKVDVLDQGGQAL